MTRSHCGRDAAKFFAGLAAGETLGHWLLGLMGTDIFPITVGRFTFTSGWNTFAMILWPVALAALVYAGWIMGERPEGQSAPPTHSAPA